MIKYIYFVSFKTPNGGGNAEIPLKSKISNFKHINEIQEFIEKNRELTNVTIDNFIFLRKTWF